MRPIRLWGGLLALPVCALAVGSAAAQTDMVRYDGHRVVSVYVKTPEQLELLLGLTDDVWNESVGLGRVDVRVSPEQFERLRATGLAHQVMIEDVQALIDMQFAERPEGVSERDPEALRAVVLEPPEGFSRELENLRALSFSILSLKKQAGRMDLLVTGGSNRSYAHHPGLTLNHVGWKDYVVPKERFKLLGDFMWRDGRRIQFATRGPKAMEFMIDDVKFIR